MAAANIRKSIVAVLTGLVTVAGQITNVTLVHGQGALWIAFGITVADAVIGALTVYTVPNGATTAQRIAALEAVAVPLIGTTVAAVDTLKHGLHPLSPADHVLAMAEVNSGNFTTASAPIDSQPVSLPGDTAAVPATPDALSELGKLIGT